LNLLTLISKCLETGFEEYIDLLLPLKISPLLLRVKGEEGQLLLGLF